MCERDRYHAYDVGALGPLESARRSPDDATWQDAKIIGDSGITQATAGETGERGSAGRGLQLPRSTLLCLSIGFLLSEGGNWYL